MTKIPLRTLTSTLNDGDQSVGSTGLAYAHAQSGKLVIAGHNIAHSLLDILPGWAIVHGVFQIFDGLALATARKEDKFYPSRTTRKLKALIQIFSGGYLAEGGLEVLNGGIFSTAPGLSLLYFRFAVNALHEFLFAFDDFLRVLSRHDEFHDPYAPIGETTSSSYSLKGTRKEIWDAAINVLAKGFAFAGWTALVYSNPIGFALLAASAICYGVKYVVPLICCGFFKQKSSTDPYGPLEESLDYAFSYRTQQ